MILKNILNQVGSKNPHALAAIVLILEIVIGYLIFYFASIDPGLRATSKLTSQIADTRKTLTGSDKILEESPGALRARIVSEQATLVAMLGAFLTDPQARQVVDRLYQSANASRVTITDLQIQTAKPQSAVTPIAPARPSPTPTRRAQITGTPPSPTPTNVIRPTPTQQIPIAPSRDLYSVITMTIQVKGRSRQLLEFASRINEASVKGFVINSMVMAEDKTTYVLNLNISVYTVLPA